MPPHSDPASLPKGTRIGRSALRVSAPDESIEFYRDVVGLSTLRRSGTTAVLGVDGTPLLVLEEDSDAPPRRSAGAGLYHAAFRVPSRAALGDALSRIRDRWELDGASDHRVSEALYLTDPEGNGVEIYRDLPRERWPRAGDGRIDIGTDPLDLESVAAAAAGDDRAPPGTVLGHVHLEVSSLAAFEEFYADTLGFEVQADVPGASFLAAGGYHHHVAANTWNRRTDPANGRERGLSWFEVALPDADALDAVRARLATRGTNDTGTDETVTVTDPDGVEVRLRIASSD